MTEKETGGPAFPDPGRAQSKKQRDLLGNTGMTLRDYFAAKAMQSLVSGEKWLSSSDIPLAANLAYKMADAMIKARQE